MKPIIVPTDFSNASLNAVHYAADMARAMNTKLILLHVVRVPVVASEIPVPEQAFDEMLDTAGQDLEDLKAGLVSRTGGKIGISTEAVIGTVVDRINEISERNSPFAVVMGMREGKSLERMLLGSNNFYSIMHNPYPVLIIPENTHYREIRKIGLACDLEAVGETIPFRLLAEWLSAFKATLDIIHVSKREKDSLPADVSQSISLQNHLNKFHPRFKFLSGRNITERLNEYTREENLDLLIVIPKHHGFAGIFDKKYSREIIARHPVPVLALHR